MPSDNDVPLLAADLIDRIERHLQADPRVLSCYVEGSPPAKLGDLYADAIVYVGFDTEESFGAVFDNIAEWLAPVTRVVFARRAGGGLVVKGMRKCLTQEGLRIDFSGHWMRHTRSRPHGRVLKETPGAFESEATPVRYQPPSANSVLESIEQFWCAFAMISRAIKDGAIAFGYMAYLDRYRDAYNILAHRGPPRVLASFQNILVSPEDDHLLASTVRVESLTPEVLAREYLKLGHLVATHAPAICQSVGAEYPLAAQEAVMRRVHNELRMHGITV